MIVRREDIYAACWARVSGLSQFVTKSRRLKHWDDVPAVQQPALFMVQHQQAPRQQKGVPPIWTFNLSLFVYDNCQGVSNAIPGQRLNTLVDAIDDALAPNGAGFQTLGGLVSHCWISGTIEIYEGYAAMMDQSVAIIPVEITVPDASGP